ncbi:ParA family protein (plasmid) [Borrelia coriaceae]|uniref:ParA family protein n=1 Tax=Borrelia coriaceae TaxID=144 RepID=UPI000487C4FE|nr:ParA family protein [Borrelia coriaceae]UPA16779.1 ParA family protein [Borrelia coriaceae]
MDRKKPEIITIASLKGGVGKSVLTIIFSYILRDMNKKVLLIDLDPQNSLTSYFISHIKKIKGVNVYYMLKSHKASNLDKYINEINDNMCIIASHPVLYKFEQEDERYKEQLLENCLDKILSVHNFDYVIIDTSPGLNFLLYNALNVTDKIVIPVQLERWSVEAFSILMNTIEEFNVFKRKKIEVSIIESQFIKNRNTLKDIEKLLFRKYGLLIKGKIHSANSIKVLINELNEPNGKDIYYKEAKEVLEKIL